MGGFVPRMGGDGGFSIGKPQGGAVALNVSDNFNRADVNPLAGNWTTVTGNAPLQIISNQATSTTTSYGTCFWNADVFAPDQCSQITAVTQLHLAIVAVRISPTANTYYMFRGGAATPWRLFKMVAGTATQLGSDYAAAVSGQVVQLCVAGNVLTPSINGVAQASVTDSSITAGQPGFGSWDTNGFIDNWSASGTTGPFGFDFTTGVLPGSITFTRASTGTYFNNTGVLSTAAANAARFNYVGGVSNLLIEPAATNLLVQSNAFGTTWFVINGAVVTAAQFVSPDGTNDGFSLTSGAGFGGVNQGFTFSGAQYTLSVWTKWLVGTALAALQMNNVNSGGISTTSATISRVSFTGTPAAASSSVSIALAAASGGSTNGIFGAQLETGPVATSYIPTTAATATRAADSATFTIPAGTGHLTYTFDDNSTQLVAVSAGSYTIPTNLARPNIKSIVGSA